MGIPKWLRVLILVILTLQGMMIPPVFAQSVGFCTSYKDIKNYLLTQYSQSAEYFGITDEGSLMEIFVSFSTSTWSAVITPPNGFACIVSAGMYWTPRIPHQREALTEPRHQ